MSCPFADHPIVGAAPPPRISRGLRSIRPEGGPLTSLSSGSDAPPRIQSVIAVPEDSARGRASHGVVLLERRPRREKTGRPACAP